METIVLVAVVVIGVIIFIGFSMLQNSQAQNMLGVWAEQNGYQLKDMTRCGLDTGPFQRMSRSSPPVFKLKMENERGRQRVAWAVCGEGRRRWSNFDPDPNLVLVVWDEEYKEGYSRRI